MRIALISDIHANLVSLNAVLDDIARKEIDQIVCLGDVCSLGPQPSGTLRRLKRLECRFVMGNHDQELLIRQAGALEIEGSPLIQEWVEWSWGQLDGDDFEFLESFQPMVEIPFNQSKKLLCLHSPPAKSKEEAAVPYAPSPSVEEILAQYDVDVVACGHTHVQMLRRLNGVMLLNVGSVGWPLEQFPFKDQPCFLPWSEYAVITLQNGNFGIELNRVAIDMDLVQKVALASDMPSADIWTQYWKDHHGS